MPRFGGSNPDCRDGMINTHDSVFESSHTLFPSSQVVTSHVTSVPRRLERFPGLCHESRVARTYDPAGHPGSAVFCQCTKGSVVGPALSSRLSDLGSTAFVLLT
jgi:hypothetical protein